ncbi:hypothetical protein ACIQLJ_08490 [Microbacterium sp. NPDC091313]
MVDGGEPGTIRIRLGVVALASLLLAIAALTTLVIVVATTRADLLSVVALALAVIAFSAQLIIYVVQTIESAAASRRSMRLHEQLSGLLSELRERSGNTQRTIDRIDARLLDAVIGKARAEGPTNAEDLAERVAEEYVRAVGQEQEPISADSDADDEGLFPRPLPPGKAARIHDYMSRWPTADEVPAVLEALQQMSGSVQRQLAVFALDDYESTTPTSAMGPGLLRVEPLASTDLVTHGGSSGRSTVLSDRGRLIGRTFTARGDAPEHAAPLIPIRQEVLEEIRKD